MSKVKPLNVLIPFNTVSLYGMERGVIETFDLLRPEIEPHFLMSFTTRRLNLPVLAEIERRGLSYSFFSDKTDWPRIGRPKSLREGWKMTIAMIRGSRDVLVAARGKQIIYLPSISYFYLAFLAAIIHRMLQRRIIYHFHDLVLSRSLGLRLASIFITDFVHHTKVGYESVVAANPFLEDKRNFVIPCALRADLHKPNGQPLLSVYGKKRNILFVGQVALHKGVDLLLEAFAMLANTHSDLALHIVGGCDDPVLMKRMQCRIQNNGCEIKWWGYRDDIAGFLRAADIYVHPSPPSRFHESFGLGLVEAMSMGIPTVCFRSGAFQEIVIHEETGLICEDEHPRALAESLDRLLRDGDFRNYCGDRARERYSEEYSAEQVKACWLRVLREEQ